MRAAGAATETHGIARKRERTRLEVNLGIDVQETASGRESRTYRRPAWSMAELAQAAAAGGVHGVAWLAVRYSVAGDASCAEELHGALAYHAQLIGRRESWPPRVMSLDGNPKFFREELAAMALDEDAHRHYFAAAPALYAVYMGVTPAVWEQTLTGPFHSLKAKYSSWISIACAGIQRALRGD
ncbi:MAG: hypothetical protein ACLQKH_12890 [Steroidobacteraceae bacterium]